MRNIKHVCEKYETFKGEIWDMYMKNMRHLYKKYESCTWKIWDVYMRNIRYVYEKYETCIWKTWGMYRVSQKRGISEYNIVYSTAQLMLSEEFSFQIHLKIEIHLLVPSTEPFLSDIREPRKRFLKHPIWHQLLASSKSSSVITIIHRLTVHSQQRDTCWVNKFGEA